MHRTAALSAALAAAALAAAPAGAAPIAGSRDFMLGIGTFATSAPDVRGHTLLTLGELRAAYRATDRFTLGLNHVTLSSADLAAGRRWALSAGPYLEMPFRLGERVELYAQVGVPVQLRFSGGPGATLGVAPYGGGGMRFFIGSGLVSVGLETRVYAVSAGGFLFQPRVLPERSVPWTGGVNVDFHL